MQHSFGLYTCIRFHLMRALSNSRMASFPAQPCQQPCFHVRAVLLFCARGGPSYSSRQHSSGPLHFLALHRRQLWHHDLALRRHQIRQHENPLSIAPCCSIIPLLSIITSGIISIVKRSIGRLLCWDEGQEGCCVGMSAPSSTTTTMRKNYTPTLESWFPKVNRVC